ncbi:DUF2163 domain-containing protein [Pseudooceanicola sediminis]|uniref:DUF2163 domain-containing protein n=1 Tax=Pseudooceanicola sediminis TaxID=2211117 RepID=A0A399JAT8_9RHOB|nr:DUF2163 domain-containing protein [Pseudooceanicola sediminis]KAA2317405.1 DUF2163 domain-containing protein [Puniceibacterium sp. HSS470]RII39756.1 DUF2163 domain-containing protein [Pseudooceanicola sediminis]|tara:strand:- start:7474 stop:8358 length:885 start_codon:yes stop_codon:yes gene_type:complete
MTFNVALSNHLAMGVTTVCHAWVITRRDGTVMGFTDHDMPLSFEGITFLADSGLTATAFQHGTGLSVDNAEAMGALSATAISEQDIEAGRYDGADVLCWLVNWAAVDERQIVFRGTIGELTRADGAFRAELRGLSETLNVPSGRIYQQGCSAGLGDASCGVDLLTETFHVETTALTVQDAQRFGVPLLASFAEGWFARGTMTVLDGAAEGLSAAIKRDTAEGGSRLVELWSPLPVAPEAGATLRLQAGCDKRFATCQAKFANTINFRGYPDIPGDDWQMVPPANSAATAGGSRR